MKKFISLALCLIFCLGALVGCGGGLGEDEKGPIVRMYLTDFPYTLDPAAIQLNNDADQILSLIFEPLTAIDQNGNVVGALAKSWKYERDEINDEDTLVIELNNTRWSDSRAVSASDVAYAWSRILDPKTNSPYASLLYGIKGARACKAGIETEDGLELAAISDTTLVVTLVDGYDYNLFLEQIANVHLSPVREDVISMNEAGWASNASELVCNGPFKVLSMDMPKENSEVESTCRLVVERNSYYRRSDEDAVDKYVTPYRVVCYYAEGQTKFYDFKGKSQESFQAERYLDGTSYLLSSFNNQTYAHFKNEMVTKQNLNGFAIYFNTENELLKDADVRKAFSAAIDRNAIVTELGTGEIAATGYVPNGVFNTDNKTDFRTEGGAIYNTSADLDAAKQLVKGKTKGDLTAIYLIPTDAYTMKKFSRYVSYANPYETVMKQAAKNWEKLGYNVTCKGLHPDEYLAALQNKEFDIIGTNILSGSTDALYYLAPFAKEYSGVGMEIDYSVEIAEDEEIFNTHYSNIDSKTYSELINSAFNASDRAERAEFLHQAEAKLAELCPATMVYWYTTNYVAKDSISGYNTNSWFGYFNFKNLTLADWRNVNQKEAEISDSRA